MVASSKDVAKYAGVSQTTVSRVLNNPELVKKPTLEKVQKAIKELNYIPNAQARSLVQKRTGTIALLSGPLHNPFFVDTTSAIVKYANEKGYRVNVQFVNDLNLSEAYSNAFELKVDGIILSCILYDDPIFDTLKQLDIPFITYNRKHKSNEFFVEIDNFNAGYLSATHMIELGHQKIAWVGGPLTISTFNNRFEGFLEALNHSGLSPSSDFIVHTDTTKQEITNAFKQLMQREDRPTAICAATDSLAINLIDIAKQENISVPHDISIMGIDNVELSQHGLINLTTVGSITGVNLGYLAINKLIELIENKNNSCVQITEAVRIFHRSTTQKLR